MGVVSIDIDAMQELVTGLSTAATRVTTLKSDLQAAMSRADGEAHQAWVLPVSFTKLDEAVSWLDDQVTPMQTRLDLARVVAGQGKPDFPTDGSSLPPGCVVQIDESLVDQLAQVVKNVQSGSLTQEQWLQLEALAGQSTAIAQWAGAELGNQVPADQLALVVQNASDQFGRDTSSDAYARYQTEGGLLTYGMWLDLKQKSYDNEVDAVGVLLGAATYSTCPPLRDSFAGEVASAINGDGPAAGPPLAGAMSLILSHGSYGKVFADTVAGEVIDTEMAGPSPTSAPDWPLVHSTGSGGSWYTDPIVGVLDMLSTNAEAAQLVFSGGQTQPVTIDGQPAQTVQVNSRLVYLMNSRDWSGASDGTGSDQGTALGDVLQAATTTFRDTQAAGQTSASIATQVFAVFGQSQEIADNMPTGLRTGVAGIVASYMPDLFTAQMTPGAVGTFTDSLFRPTDFGFLGAPAGAEFTQDEMNRILAALGQNTDDVKIVGAGRAVTNQVWVANNFAGSYGSPEAQAAALNGIDDGFLKDQLRVGADVFGNIMTGAKAGNAKLAKDEAGQAELKNDILGFITAIPVPGFGLAEPASKWVDWMVTETKNGFGDVVKNKINNAGTAADQANDATVWGNKAVTSAVDATYQTMYDQGFWGPVTLGQANAEDKATKAFAPPPPAAFLPDGHTFDTSSDAYQTWKRGNSGVEVTIEDAIRGAYGIPK